MGLCAMGLPHRIPYGTVMGLHAMGLPHRTTMGPSAMGLPHRTPWWVRDPLWALRYGAAP